MGVQLLPTDPVEQKWLTTDQVAERLGIPAGTLVRWRYEGKGPRWTRLGDRLIRYYIHDVEQWEREQRYGAS